jgi:phosphatidylglycerol:prolipoprotein diacylglycerol transferase
MIHEVYQHLPQHIDPIAFSIGSFSVRWYAVSYLMGFVVVYCLIRLRISRGENPEVINHQSSVIENSKTSISGRHALHDDIEKIQDTKYKIQNTAFDLLLIAFFSALIGGRLGYVLFYDWTYFVTNPLAIISPYNQEGLFVGIFGMSYHGALLGIIFGSWLFLTIKKQSFLAWADFFVPAIALGYFFGRIGNFLNGELYGRVTNSPLGMYFTADSHGLRHPSQLYEALLEGLLLFLFLWTIRKRKMPTGSFFAIYLVGYGLMRIISEQFREPDVQVGFLLGHVTLGQALSLVMIFAGTALFSSLSKKEK